MSERLQNRGTRCVVLAPLASKEAVGQLAQRQGWDARIEHHPALAMAETSLLRNEMRAGSSRSAPGRSAPGQGPLLILFSADDMPGIKELINAMRRYFPDSEVAQWREGRLQPIMAGETTIDQLPDPPIVHSEPVDAAELSMLLDPLEPEREP